MRKLIIEHFGPVLKAELELKDVNLLIGEQSIGKSTIAKLITIVTDIYSLTTIINRGFSGWLYQLQSYGLNIYSEDGYYIQYEWEENDIHFVLTIKKENVNTSLTKNKSSITDKREIGKELFMLKPIYHREQFMNQVNTFLDTAESLESKDISHSLQQLVLNSIYIPAERIFFSFFNKALPALNLLRESIPQNLLRFALDLQNAKAAYNRYEAALLNVLYEYESSEDYFTDNTSGHKYPLSHASSGIQSTMPLLLVLEYAVNKMEYSSFVIEEPETNLFPDKQVELLRYIIKTVNKEGRTLTITTHSPYLLSALNNSLFAGSLLGQYGEEIEKGVSSVLNKEYCLTAGECSVYSLGESVNGKGVYCKSVVDPETGMIDSNALDGVSLLLSAEFDKLENAFLEYNKRNG